MPFEAAGALVLALLGGAVARRRVLWSSHGEAARGWRSTKTDSLA